MSRNQHSADTSRDSQVSLVPTPLYGEPSHNPGIDEGFSPMGDFWGVYKSLIFVFMRLRSLKSAEYRRASVNPSLLVWPLDGRELLACFQLSDSRFVYGRAGGRTPPWVLFFGFGCLIFFLFLCIDGSVVW